MSFRALLSKPATLYYALWLSIVGISVHDGYLVLLYKHSIAADEQNPVGRWLIDADSGNIRLLLAAKLAGTILVAAALLAAFWTRPRIAWPMCISIALFQFGLLAYLTTR